MKISKPASVLADDCCGKREQYSITNYYPRERIFKKVLGMDENIWFQMKWGFVSVEKQEELLMIAKEVLDE